MTISQKEEAGPHPAQPPFREYLLVAQDRVSVEHFYFQEPGVWAFREYLRQDDEVAFQSIPLLLPLSTVYRGISV